MRSFACAVLLATGVLSVAGGLHADLLSVTCIGFELLVVFVLVGRIGRNVP